MIVLDASALVDLVADGAAKTSLARRLDGQMLAAPAHQMAEVAAALARLVRAGDLRAEDGRTALALAARLPQQIHPLDARLMDRAWALRERIRILDGVYVALAERLSAPLLTSDRRLAAAQPPCEVLVPD